MGWITLGFKLAPIVIAAVNGVEKIVKGVKGKDKQDAAVNMVTELLPAIEGAADKDLLNDAEVQRLLRALIDATVAFQNGLAAAKRLKPAA